jgi:hypothetical protein
MKTTVIVNHPKYGIGTLIKNATIPVDMYQRGIVLVRFKDQTYPKLGQGTYVPEKELQYWLVRRT